MSVKLKAARVLLPYFLAASLIFTLSSLYLYNSFSKRTIEEIGGHWQETLGQTAYSTDFIWNWTFYYASQLYKDALIVEAIYAADDNVVRDAQVFRRLADEQLINPLLDSIYLVNFNNDSVISTEAGKKEREAFADQDIFRLLHDPAASRNGLIVPRVAETDNRGTVERKRLLSMVMAEWPTADEPLQGALVLNLDVAKFQRFLDAMNPSGASELLIIDDRGEVLSASDEELFMRNVANLAYIRRILDSGQQRQWFNDLIGGKPYIVSFHSTYNTNWKLIGLTPHDSILSKVRETRDLILQWSLILFGSFVVIAFMISNRLHAPLRRLALQVGGWMKQRQGAAAGADGRGDPQDERYLSEALGHMFGQIEKLESESAETRRHAKQMRLRALLKGDRDAAVSDALPAFDPLEGAVLVLVRIDDYAEFQEKYNHRSRSLFKYGMTNIVEEVLGRASLLGHCEMEDDNAVYVLARDEAVDEAAVLAKIQAYVRQYLRITVTCAYSAPIREPEAFHAAYRELAAWTELRYNYGHQLLLDEMWSKAQLGRLKHEFANREAAIQQILKALKLDHSDQAVRLTEEMIESIRDYTYPNILLMLIQFVYAVSQTAESILSPGAFNPRLTELKRTLESMDTLDSAKAWVVAFLSDTMETIGQSKRNRRPEIVRQAIRYMEENYRNPQLNADTVADQVGLSAKYLAILIKRETGLSVSEYLHRMRMDKVRQLLAATDDTVEEIAEQAGFPAGNYFYKAFKKATGITPIQYRRQSRSQDEGSLAP